MKDTQERTTVARCTRTLVAKLVYDTNKKYTSEHLWKDG